MGGYQERRLTLKASLVLCAACWASGCSGDDGDKGSGAGNQVTIASTPLSGLIGGQSWSLNHAETDSFLSDEATFFLTAYAEPGTACDSFFQPTQNELIVIVPKAPGDYALGLDHAATFVVDPGGMNDNLIALTGDLVVEEVTATSLRGGLAVEYNAANHVNGRFEASICPPE